MNQAFLNFYLFFVLIEKMKLDQVIVGVGKHFYVGLKFLIPFIFYRVEKPTLRQMRMDDWVNVKSKKRALIKRFRRINREKARLLF